MSGLRKKMIEMNDTDRLEKIEHRIRNVMFMFLPVINKMNDDYPFLTERLVDLLKASKHNYFDAGMIDSINRDYSDLAGARRSALDDLLERINAKDYGE